MREFYTTIDEALLRGLRTETITPRNSSFLDKCLGFRIGKRAIEGIESLSNPLPPAIDMFYNWPFPQFLKQESWKILIVRDSVTNMEDVVYSLDASYVATQIFAIDELTFGKGTLMELADFGEYAYMTNGVVMIYWDVSINDWQEVTAHANIPMMQTVCNFKGQMIGGCVTSAWHDCDEKSIVWSGIGNVDFTPDRKNEAGYRRDPFGGEVYHVRRLGDNVIVYSSGGVTRMFPVTSPAATFGFQELHKVGLKNRGAMNGDLNQHTFVDLENSVWKLNKEGLEELGYIEYVRNLDSGDNIVSFDPYKRDFYISDGVDSLLLSPNGMSNYPYPVSTTWYDDESAHGLCGLPGTPSPPTYEPLLVSHIIDMGYRGQKTIFSIEIGASNAVGAKVAVDWRMDSSVSFERTGFVPVNNEGIASLIATGTEFRICMNSESFTKDLSSLDYINVRWKMTDLRGLRGIYAAPPRGQSAY
jgi:hypothetical protein